MTNFTNASVVVVRWTALAAFADPGLNEWNTLHLVWGRYRAQMPLDIPAVLCIGVGGPGRSQFAEIYSHPLNSCWHGRIANDTDLQQATSFVEWIFVQLTGATHAPDRSPIPPTRRGYVVNEWPPADVATMRRGRGARIGRRLPAVMSWSPESSELRCSATLTQVERGSL